MLKLIMMVLCSNHSSTGFLSMVSENPGKLGWLISPLHYKHPREGVPFALDNDAYADWLQKRDFDFVRWVEFLNKVRKQPLNPMWCVVPDAVADRSGTLARWKRFAPVARCYGWPLAFVAQDGMTPRDVPKDAAIVFVGGTTSFKWRSLPMWCEHFPRVHVGRCGTSRWKLERVEDLGAESCDGSGWFRATINGREARQLKAWLNPIGKQIDLLPMTT